MDGPSRVAVIWNPTKDFRKVESFVRRASERDGRIRFEVLRTESFEDIARKARQAYSGGCDLCVAAGGDGTVLGVLNAAIERDACFSILPLGTGNDFAKSLGVDGVEGAARALVGGRVRSVDAGLCAYRGDDGSERRMYFGSTAGVGVLARVFSYERHRITAMLKSILGNGVWPLLTTVSVFSGGACPTDLLLNDARISTSLRLFEVSKVREAGGTVFTPGAAVDNGIFDAWMLHDTSAFGAMDFFMKSGKPEMPHLSCPGLTQWSGDARLTRIEVTPEKPLHVHLNGDRVGLTPCRMELLPGKLKVLC
jgi:diacylglycerol kinase (ATP)